MSVRTCIPSKEILLAASATNEAPREVFTYSEGRDKQATIRRYLAAEGAVIVAPSMDRGVDLPGDACRVCIVAKMPYMALADVVQVGSRNMHNFAKLLHNFRAN